MGTFSTLSGRIRSLGFGLMLAVGAILISAAISAPQSFGLENGEPEPPAQEEAIYTSRLVIEIVDADGNLTTPSNVLTDASVNLTKEQANEHHYLLKQLYANGLLTPETVAKAKAAVQEL